MEMSESKIEFKIDSIELNSESTHAKKDNSEQIRRNGLCPCGSKKKYKKCCYSRQVRERYFFYLNLVDITLKMF